MFGYDGYSPNYEYRDVLLEHFSGLGQIISYDKDALIEFEYARLSYAYLIIEGKVKQFFTTAEGQEKTILILSKGDMFGEITMIQGDHDHCITKTYVPTKVCKITREAFDAYLAEHPELYESILQMLTTKIRLLMYQVFDGNYLDAKERLYALLQRLSVQHAIHTDKGIAIDLSLTHEEIARMIGSTRSTVTKLMKLLEDEGRIQREGKQIIRLF